MVSGSPWNYSAGMSTAVSRDAYFETGLEVLADRGYGGLKLAEVCRRLGVTTGSFYHYFANWPAYTRELIAHWVEERTTSIVKAVSTEPDPRRRLDAYVQVGVDLPHGAEAAIRIWGATNPEVHAVQVDVDRERFNSLYDTAMEIIDNERGARLFATSAMYLLVGFEQATLTRDTDAFAWLAGQLVDGLYSGQFESAPDVD